MQAEMTEKRISTLRGANRPDVSLRRKQRSPGATRMLGRTGPFPLLREGCLSVWMDPSQSLGPGDNPI